MKNNKIASYLREVGAKFLGSSVEKNPDGVPVNYKFFADKSGELVATLASYVINKSAKSIHRESALVVKNGMRRDIVKNIDLAALIKYKGKENIIFPRNIEIKATYETPNEISIVKGLSIPKGIEFVGVGGDWNFYKTSKKFKINRFNEVSTYPKITNPTKI